MPPQMPPALDDKLGNDEWVKDQFLGNGTRPGHNKSHWNRWCKRCLEAQVEATVKSEARRFEARELNVLREAEAIRADILTNPGSLLPKPIVSKLDSLITHLASCKNVTDSNQNHAVLLKQHRTPPRPNFISNKENHHPGSRFQIQRTRTLLLSPLAVGGVPGPSLASITSSPSSPTPLPGHSRLLTHSDTLLLSPATSSPGLPSPLDPTYTLLRTNSRSSSTSSLKRMHSGSESESDYAAYLGVGSNTLAFPPRLKDEFQTDFCKLLLSGNCAFRLAESPYWQHFFTKWIPGAELPSRQAVSGCILDAEADRVLEGMKMHLQGRYGTGQSDGWKSISKASIIASMLNAEYDPYILHSHDVTEQPKTAENLLKIVDAEIDFCEKVLNVTLAAWCTDGGGDCAKMRRLLRAKRPDLATPHCWSHQIRLTVGDYLKEKLPVVDVLDVALEVIKWFNNHTGALALLRQEQQRQYGRVLALFRPVPTRWTSHYLSGDRLLETEDAMRVCILTSKAKLITCAGKERAQVEKAKNLLGKLEEPSFWSLLREARTQLEPLAIACNATQGDNARLDVVLVTLGNLYHIYCDSSRFDDTIRAIMHKSLEMRWKKVGSERDLYILAIVLNPFLRLAPLRKNNPLFTRQSLWRIFKSNYIRMIEANPPATALTALYSAFMEYLSGIGEWSDEAMGLSEIAQMAEHSGNPINLMTVWRGVDTQDASGANGLVKFALRLFAIVPNSAGVERLFSLLGIIQTKHRNRLGVEKSRKVVLVKADINRTHGTGRQQQRRHFGHKEAVSKDSEDPPVLTLGGATPDPTAAELATDSVQVASQSAAIPGESVASEDSLPTPDSVSFRAVAAELFEMVAEEAADTDAGEPEASTTSTVADAPSGDLESTSSMAPLLADMLPVPRGAAALELKYIFAYPSPTSFGTSHGISGNPLMTFWTRSKANLNNERVRYEEDDLTESCVVPNTSDGASLNALADES